MRNCTYGLDGHISKLITHNVKPTNTGSHKKNSKKYVVKYCDKKMP